MVLLWMLSLVWLKAQNYEQLRVNMVKDQIAARGVTHQATLRAMQEVPRHLFVPSSERAVAYGDHPLPIGYGQTISQPYIVGYMTDAIQPKSGDVILEIGTGSGYQAAVLAEIGAQVYTIEIVKELSLAANTLLKRLEYDNIEVRHADGYFGWREHAPYDAIIVTAATEFIPKPLLDQLKDDGKMIVPVGSPFQVQQLMLVQKKDGKVKTKGLLPVRFVPFTRQSK